MIIKVIYTRTTEIKCDNQFSEVAEKIREFVKNVVNEEGVDVINPGEILYGVDELVEKPALVKSVSSTEKIEVI